MRGQAFVGITVAFGLTLLPSSVAADSIFINEFHYENASTDINQFVEIAVPVGTDVSQLSVALYDGSTGQVYDTKNVDSAYTRHVIAESPFTLYSLDYPSGIQDGAPDGIALANGSSVLQFISYEGSFTATNGLAAGATSTDVGVRETATTSSGASIQLFGTGNQYSDFSWRTFNPHTQGAVNFGQTFTPLPAPVPLPAAASAGIVLFAGFGVTKAWRRRRAEH